ncbi:GNAT family N-acetyltransferase [Pseudemcibacter aquimaris]|uniref:GNAT family N-acetyltransferase n=1 Tax=Pseudemcibacter aquimaris TaxID=2857064 RepID=UPI002012D679|nr:GNAT family N-acetyltransferase [Pseudemcibacter aquimaris]MCC3860482.1 GNAT family N-acetyltransferase [Pseudemcibacter aquimaris]WDU59307.1 GNAT family N-acetyltransferase [Pseudemcibacter aquimaris]
MKYRVFDKITDIPQGQWDRCNYTNNPFSSYGFLSALEESGCVNANTGWHPQHIAIIDDDEIVGVLPQYLKSHSQGEYVFDHGWANAYEQAGGHYYPKMQSSIPFSPVNGPKLLSPIADVRQQLLHAAISHTEELGISGLHFTFITDDEATVMTSQELLLRQDQQFHWFNDNYKTFDHFLNTLSSRKRKNIKKERETALSNDIEIEWLNGKDIKEVHWDHYYEFYINTSNRKWGRPYLNRAFFSILSENIPNDILLIMAKRDGRYIAGALNLIGPDTLYGRYWGSTEYHKCLHFELCYYQAIDFAIEQKLKKVEAGAQGDHKIARGYIPIATNSAHWITNPSFKDAIKKFLAQERKAVKREIDYLSGFTPYKNTD